ncbi:phage holin family protein [Priestia endophytica]|uniref:phage holin family protein n=1 Tax=Priestia endophytica TaxID=135735 RepID=UPI0020413BFA|nr:phage holin family protein [Priestia endophytica]MCM3536606.1 phage holin family protein [Priestia endophytica]
MDAFTVFLNEGGFQAASLYLFGGVKFLDLLCVLMLADVITGVLKAIKIKRLRSRKALFGYARKIGVFVAIIVANIVDQILGLNGAVALATVLFYLANEGLSIVENLAQIGVKVPSVIADKLHVISEEKEKEDNKSL